MSVAFSRNAEKIFPFCRLFIPAFSAWTVHFTDHRARVGALRPYELSWHRHLGLFFEIPVREGDGPVSHESCMPSGLAGPVWEGVLTPILLAAMHPSSAVWCTGTFGGGGLCRARRTSALIAPGHEVPSDYPSLLPIL